MFEIWTEVERSEQAVADAETDEDYAKALKELESVLKRYTERVQACIDQPPGIDPGPQTATLDRSGK